MKTAQIVQYVIAIALLLVWGLAKAFDIPLPDDFQPLGYVALWLSPSAVSIAKAVPRK